VPLLQREGWPQEGAPKAFVDLHSHSSSSFDSLSDPIALTRAAAARGITHLAITDHDRVDGAQRARDAQIPGITVLVGSEVRTRDGDMIALFIERPIKVGLPPAEVIAAIREQGGLVGIPTRLMAHAARYFSRKNMQSSSRSLTGLKGGTRDCGRLVAMRAQRRSRQHTGSQALHRQTRTASWRLETQQRCSLEIHQLQH